MWAGVLPIVAGWKELHGKDCCGLLTTRALEPYGKDTRILPLDSAGNRLTLVGCKGEQE